MTERIPVPTWEGVYSVDPDTGEVWTETRVLTMKNGRPKTIKARPMRARVADNGYLQVGLRSKERGRKTMEVHRVVAWAVYGPQPAGSQVRHLNGYKMDNRACNLEYGTPQENRADAVKHGTAHYDSRRECSNRHPYLDGHTKYRETPDNQRVCKACARARNFVRWYPHLADHFIIISWMYWREMAGIDPPVKHGGPKKNRLHRAEALISQQKGTL